MQPASPFSRSLPPSRSLSASFFVSRVCSKLRPSPPLSCSIPGVVFLSPPASACLPLSLSRSENRQPRASFSSKLPAKASGSTVCARGSSLFVLFQASSGKLPLEAWKRRKPLATDFQSERERGRHTDAGEGEGDGAGNGMGEKERAGEWIEIGGGEASRGSLLHTRKWRGRERQGGREREKGQRSGIGKMAHRSRRASVSGERERVGLRRKWNRREGESRRMAGDRRRRSFSWKLVAHEKMVQQGAAGREKRGRRAGDQGSEMRRRSRRGRRTGEGESGSGRGRRFSSSFD